MPESEPPYMLTDLLREAYRGRFKDSTLLKGFMQDQFDSYPAAEAYVLPMVKKKKYYGGSTSTDDAQMDEADQHQIHYMEIEEPSQAEGGSEETVLDLIQLFDKPTSENHQIISVYGEAKVGKTALCRHIVEKWSKSGLWNDKFDMVILLSSGDITPTSQYIESIVKEKYFLDTELDVTQESMITGPRTLFIFDGFDELKDTSRALVLEIMRSSKASFIVTSKSQIVGAQPNAFSVELEIKGFADVQHITKYIKTSYDLQRDEVLKIFPNGESTDVSRIAYLPVFQKIMSNDHTTLTVVSQEFGGFQNGKFSFSATPNKIVVSNPQVIEILTLYYDDRQKAILAFLNSNPVMLRLAQSPFYLKLLCFAFDEFLQKTESIEGVTITTLYSTVVNKLLELTPSSDITSQSANRLEALETEAFRNIKMDLDMGSHMNSQPQGSIATSLDESIVSVFPSLDLFQEYLAARYIANHINDGEVENFLSEFKYQEKYQLLWQHVAGTLFEIIKITTSKENKYFPLIRFWHYIETAPRDLIGFRHIELVIRCLNECPIKVSETSVYLKLMGDVQVWALSHDITNILSSAPNVGKMLERREDFIEKLIQRINSRDPKARILAIKLSGSIGHVNDRVVASISKILSEEAADTFVLNEVIRSLYKLGRISINKESLLVLIQNDKIDPYIKNSAVRELIYIEEIENGLAIRTLIGNLRSSVVAVRDFASQLLIDLVKKDQTNASLNLVLDALKPIDDGGRGAKKDRNKLALINQQRAIMQVLFEANSVIPVSEETFQILLDHINSKDGSIILAATNLLISPFFHPLVDDKTFDCLYKALNDGSNYVRESAIKALAVVAEVDPQKVKEKLVEVSKLDKFPSADMVQVRSSVLLAFSMIKVCDERIINLIKLDLDRSYINLRTSAAIALMRLGGSHEKVKIIGVLSESILDLNCDPHLRSRAIGVLGNTLPHSAVKSVVQTSGDNNPYIKLASIRALAGLNAPEVIDALIKALSSENTYVRSASIKALRSSIENGEWTDESLLLTEIARALLSKISRFDQYTKMEAIQAIYILLHKNIRFLELLLGDNGSADVEQVLRKFCILKGESLNIEGNIITVDDSIVARLTEKLSSINLEVQEYYIKSYPLGYAHELRTPELTKLHKAAQLGHVEDIKNILEESKIDINDQGNDDGYTPLMMAINAKQWGVARFLISLGASVNLFSFDYTDTARINQAEGGSESVSTQIANDQGRNAISILFDLYQRDEDDGLFLEIVKERKPIGVELLRTLISSIALGHGDIDTVFKRLFGYASADAIIQEDISGISVSISRSKIYELYLAQVESLKIEHRELIHGQGDDESKMLSIRGYLYLKLLLEECSEPESIFYISLEKELLILLEVLRNVQIIDLYTEHGSNADNVITNQAEHIISQAYASELPYCFPVSYIYSAVQMQDEHGVWLHETAHILYVSLKKTEVPDEVLIRIDDRLDHAQEPIEKGGIMFIKPRILGTVKKDEKKLLGYIRSLLKLSSSGDMPPYQEDKFPEDVTSALAVLQTYISDEVTEAKKALRKKFPPAGKDMKSAIDIIYSIDSPFTTARLEEYRDLPEVERQEYSENCILSGHDLGVRTRLGKDLFPKVSKREKQMISAINIDQPWLFEPKKQEGQEDASVTSTDTLKNVESEAESAQQSGADTEDDSAGSAGAGWGTISIMQKLDGGFWSAYYLEGVNTILPIRLRNLPVITNKAIIIHGNRNISPVDIVIPASGDRVIIPIFYKVPYQSQFHWVLVALKREENILHATYIDPENNPVPKAIIQSIANVIPEGCSITFFQIDVELQQYRNNCGPYIIEIARWYLTGESSIAQELIKFTHSMLYEEFLCAQSKDIPLLSQPPEYEGAEKRGALVAIGLDEEDAELSSDPMPCPYLAKLQTTLYKAAIVSKSIDLGVDIVEAYQIPTLTNIKDVAVGQLQLYSMYGFNGFSKAASTLLVAHTWYEEGLNAAFHHASITAAYAMFSSAVVKVHPGLATAYSACLSVYTLYSAASKAFELYNNRGIVDHELKSLHAYRDLTKFLYETTSLEFFKIQTNEYNIQIDMLAGGIEDACLDEVGIIQ